MKLKTLNIHNIASKEDATIDFAGPQLSGQDLFLICGPTGSGKSTILDSICLALFNKTPRVENSANDSIDELADEENRKKEKLKDVMHMVRKNAAEAYVSLTFEGIDGNKCTATWRARRKVSKKGEVDTKRYENETLEEKLKRDIVREWMLEDGDGNTFSKVSEVEDKIKDIIKMNYDQFIKTTMLAQGDFTKFLASSSDAKAEILEKLVGTQKYGEVGRAINQSTRAKANDVELLKRELENVRFLSEEEIAEYQNKVSALKTDIESLDSQKESVAQKLKWIADSNKALQEKEKASESASMAESSLKSDDVQADINLVELWLKTSDIRSAIKVQEDCIVQARMQEEDKQRLEKDYIRALSGLISMKEKAGKVNKEIERGKEIIAQQSKFEDMFSHAAVICKAHEDVVSNQTLISKYEIKLADFDKEIGQFEERLSILNKDKEEASLKITAVEERQRELQKELQVYKADSIDEEVSMLNAHKLLVSQTETALSAWMEAKEDAVQKRQCHDDAVNKKSELDKAVTKAAEDLSRANELYTASKTAYEKTKASVEDHAKVLRAELQIGDHCPVCGKLIEEVLTDDRFAIMLKPLEEAFRREEKTFNECTKSEAQAKADAKAGEKALSDASRDAEKADAKQTERYSDLKKKCEALDIACDDNIGKRLAELKTDDNNAEAALAKRQQYIKDIRSKIHTLINEADSIRKSSLDVAMASIETVSNDISKAKAEKQTLVGHMDAAKKTAETKQQYIDSSVNPEWTPSSADTYFSDLKIAAEEYGNVKAELIKKQSSYDQYQRDVLHIEECKKEILQKFAEWESINDVPSSEVQNITTMWSSLQSEAYVMASDMTKTAENKLKADKEIELFFSQHDDVAKESVRSAMSFNASEIEKKRKHIKTLEEALTSAKAGLEAALKAVSELPDSPLADGESAESLTEQLSVIGTSVQDKNQEIGRINNELDTDRRNRGAQGEKKQKLEKLMAEYSEWCTLDKYLGSTDGKNFRNLAQSFILGTLLEKANAYLENITGRYTLFCNPGTLTIMMRDAYQGGVVRPTNTLSGGESFIISLSLALGLSSMQSSGFEVDTLFIDEGFGTLSPEFLDPVITSLKRLYEQYGRRVGIISHVETLKARIPVAIEVSREGNSSSKVEIVMN